MSIMKEKLSQALQNQKNDVNSYIWKGKKVKTASGFIQDEIKLVDATDSQLKEFHSYCDTMLNNTSPDSLGRNHVLSVIRDQRQRCNAELCLRDLENVSETMKVPRYQLNLRIQEFLNTNNSVSPKSILFGDVSEVNREFADVPLNLIIEGCIDKLGVFNRKHLKLSFILKQGLWLTAQEMNELLEYDSEGNVRNRLDVVRERLNINENIDFKISTKGLSYAQLRAMYQLKNKKYSEMTTEQLVTLRNRILFNLEHEVNIHIAQWDARKKQIEEVAALRGLELI